MPFQKVEFEFPDEEDKKADIEIESSDAIEIDISGKKPKAPPKKEEENNNDLEIEVVDDVPKSDRGRKPSTPPTEVTDEELEEYSEKVRNRIKHFSKGYHDERRAKEQATRERQELEKYTWFGSDKEMTGYAMGLHEKLVSEGVDPSSDEYYETINSRMQTLFPNNFEGVEEKAKSKRQPNVVAPASRSASPKKVTLTQTQVAIAKRLGVPLELYAKKVAEEMRKV